MHHQQIEVSCLRRDSLYPLRRGMVCSMVKCEEIAGTIRVRGKHVAGRDYRYLIDSSQVADACCDECSVWCRFSVRPKSLQANVREAP